MSRKYKFYDTEGLYFISFAVVNWIDVFTRNEYKDIVLESWQYCQDKKGLNIHAWCIMTNHIHMIISSSKNKPEDIIRDMKSFTSRHIRMAIEKNPEESRKGWMLKLMYRAGINKINNKEFQFWQQHNQPILLDNNHLIEQKLNYIHMNPVKAGIVENPEDYVYSSAKDYAGLNGLIKIKLIE